MASESTTSRPEGISQARLWFGLSAAFFCWFLTGIAEMLITWRAGLHNEAFGNASLHPGLMAASFVVSALLMGATAVAGFTAYRSWRRLSRERVLYEAEGREHREYMALLGVFASFTLGSGLVWMLIPLFILRFCARVR